MYPEASILSFAARKTLSNVTLKYHLFNRITKTSNRISHSHSSSSSSSPKSAFYDSPTSKQSLESPCSHRTPVHQQNSSFSCSSLKDAVRSYDNSYNVSPCVKQFINSPTSGSKGTNPNHVNHHFSGPPNYEISQQSLILSELEFRKLFMVHSYIGSNKMEDVVSIEDAIKIRSLKTMLMLEFEDWMWSKFGCHYCQPSDRAMYLDWDSGKTHLYTCYVRSDGGYQFKGPYLDNKKTHLQRAIGDENVLIVKFSEAAGTGNKNYEKISEAGILVGLTRYRFFVFKDDGKERKKKGKEDKKRGSSVKCYFVKRESIAPWNERERDSCIMSYKTTHDVRCLFMHVHMVSSMTKYIARFSLILSTTIKLQVDLASVSVEEIDDIPCVV